MVVTRPLTRAPYWPEYDDGPRFFHELTYANRSAPDVLEEPSPVVTTTSTVPVMDAVGLVAVINVSEFTTTFVAGAWPKSTVAGDAKFDPVIVTDVPPATGPARGESERTAGGGPRLP